MFNKGYIAVGIRSDTHNLVMFLLKNVTQANMLANSGLDKCGIGRRVRTRHCGTVA